MNLRKLAKGRECQVRIPHRAAHDPETVVLAHYRLSGLSGMGMKSPDWCGAWACYVCHGIIDGREKSVWSRERLHLWHLEGCMRTLAILEREGVRPW